MSVTENPVHAREPISDREQKMVALGYLHEAWAEARLDGVDGDCLAQACLFSALAELVSTYGEDATAKFAEGCARASATANSRSISPANKSRRTFSVGQASPETAPARPGRRCRKLALPHHAAAAHEGADRPAGDAARRHRASSRRARPPICW